jgi:DNA-binding NarL/FixJ family response regulator
VTRVVIVADSGPALQAITATVIGIRGAHIVGYGSSRTRLERILAQARPDLVVLADVHTLDVALARLMEVKKATASAKVVVISARSDAGWLAEALRARAAAVVPGRLDPRTLGVVLREVVDEADRRVRSSPVPSRDRTPVGSARAVAAASCVPVTAGPSRVKLHDRRQRRSALNKEVPMNALIEATGGWGTA